MTPCRPPRRGTSGFTLVELLVSIVILSILLVALSTVTAFVSKSWLNGIGAVDSSTKARVLLGILDRDIQMMILRKDVAAFVDGNGNPACAFYTAVQGYPGTDTRAISLVQYKTTSATSTLQRLCYGLNYPPTVGTTPVALTLTIGNTANLSQLASVSATTQTETLASGVLLFELQFLDGTGNVLTTDGPAPNLTAFHFDFSNPGASTNPRIAIVSLLVLSDSAYNLAVKSGTLTSMLNLFAPTNLKARQTYSQYWNSILNPAAGTFGAGLPETVRRNLQIYERPIPLPITTPSS